jgi:hypothetical protein
MQIPDYIDITIWTDYGSFRKETRHKLTPTAIKYLLLKLDRLHNEGMDVNACIMQSMENGWRGVFPIKVEKEIIPKSDDEAVRWGAAHGINARPGENMWNYRQRLEAAL